MARYMSYSERQQKKKKDRWLILAAGIVVWLALAGGIAWLVNKDAPPPKEYQAAEYVGLNPEMQAQLPLTPDQVRDGVTVGGGQQAEQTPDSNSQTAQN